MSVTWRRRGGEAVALVDATGGAETVQLPLMASLEAVIVRRLDGSGNTVTVTVQSGKTLDGATNGSTTVAGDSEKKFIALDAGWESLTSAGGGGGGAVDSVVGRTGVVTGAHIAADPGLSGTYGPTTFVAVTTAAVAAAGEAVEADTTGGAFTVTLPTNPQVGSVVSVQKISADGNVLTVAAAGGGTINGDATLTTSTRWAGCVLRHRGGNVWRIVESNAALSSGSSATVPGAPTGVSAVAGNAQATVSFTAPASNGGSAITGYTATSTPGSLTASGASSPLTVTGLTNGTAYTFTVHATNAIGNGPESSASSAVTPTSGATAPGAPTGLTATAGNAQASLSWTAPASNGGSAVADYVVQYRTTSGPGAWTTFTDGTSTTTSATVTGLTNGTGYDFQVAAVNAIGTGAYSATASATPAGSSTIVQDTFTGADGTSLGAHTGEVGATWTHMGTSAFDTLSANALLLAALDETAYTSGTPGTADYSVTLDYRPASTTAIAGPGLRMVSGAQTGYYLWAYNGQFILDRSSQAIIGTAVTPSGGISTSVTYRMTVKAVGTTITGRVQRLSDNQYLTSAGAWQAGAVDCITVTDANVTAAGRAGYFHVAGAAGGTFDNFTAVSA